VETPKEVFVFFCHKISKKSPIILIVISYNLKPVKISYANGRVSVRIFYKNNLINVNSFLSTHATHATLEGELRFNKLIRKKIHPSATTPLNTPYASSTLPTQRTPPPSPLLNAYRQLKWKVSSS
jgi:hypothetical protein